MCYSVESSLRTTTVSLLAIIYLFQSNHPYFKWIAVSLIGWCGMQFAELLLWLTEPQYGCTKWNTVITFTVIPIALALQAVAPMLGSLFVIPWAESSSTRKNIVVLYCILSIATVAYLHFYKPKRICTMVTPKGHLHWQKDEYPSKNLTKEGMMHALWFVGILLPFFMYWRKSFFLPILLVMIGIGGFLYGQFKTDSHASIWCFYTSWTSVAGSIALFLKQMGIYNFL